MGQESSGFTLIELIIVMGLIAILTSAVLIAVNPGRQFTIARDTQRKGDLYGITNAIYQYAAEHNGNVPPPITSIQTDIGNGDGFVNLSTVLVPTYIASIPIDPTTGTETNTQYQIYKNAQGRVTAIAQSELTPGGTISITR